MHVGGWPPLVTNEEQCKQQVECLSLNLLFKNRYFVPYYISYYCRIIIAGCFEAVLVGTSKLFQFSAPCLTFALPLVNISYYLTYLKKSMTNLGQSSINIDWNPKSNQIFLEFLTLHFSPRKIDCQGEIVKIKIDPFPHTPCSSQSKICTIIKIECFISYMYKFHSS